MRASAGICAILGALLTGCSTTQSEFTKAVAEARPELEQCETKYPFRRGTAVARMNCLAEVRNRRVRHVMPHRDLLDLQNAAQLNIASRLDRGQISQEEAQLALAQQNTQVIGEMDRRDLARRAVRAAEAASDPVTCTRTGNTTFCY